MGWRRCFQELSEGVFFSLAHISGCVALHKYAFPENSSRYTVSYFSLSLKSPRKAYMIAKTSVFSFRWYQGYRTNLQSHRYGFFKKQNYISKIWRVSSVFVFLFRMLSTDSLFPIIYFPIRDVVIDFHELEYKEVMKCTSLLEVLYSYCCRIECCQNLPWAAKSWHTDFINTFIV